MKICLVLSEPTLEAAIQVWEQHAAWADMAELRVDQLQDSEWVGLGKWRRQMNVPLILTLRRPEDGGRWEGDAAEREAFYRSQLPESWDYWDIEEAHPLPAPLEEAYRKSGGRIIRSFHDFSGVPSDLGARIANNARLGDIPKAAVMTNTIGELRRLFREVKSLQPGDRVVLAMGAVGVSTRILGEDWGSLWTYASPCGRQAAPGQLDPKTLKELYAANRRRAGEPIFGIAGNPIGHSKSPLVHNTGFRRLGLPGVYLPFQVDNFQEFLHMAEELGVKGLSVTIPHKEAAARACAVLDPSVEKSGACNTMVRRDSRWYGYNTDAIGFVRPLLEAFKSHSLHGRQVTVVGTGGAARGVLYALKKFGADVLLLGRNWSKVQTFAEEFHVKGAPLAPESLDLVKQFNDSLIQTTSAGMGNQTGIDPLEWYPWQGSEIAYDIVYNPKETAFLKRAKQSGCKIIYGDAMFREQAKEQFRLFTGYDYPGEFPDLSSLQS